MKEKKIASHIKLNGWSKKVTFCEMNMCITVVYGTENSLISAGRSHVFTTQNIVWHISTMMMNTIEIFQRKVDILFASRHIVHTILVQDWSSYITSVSHQGY